MSSLTGHRAITRRSIALLSDADGLLPRPLPVARVAAHVVARDLIDSVTLGHWRNAAQCHHFMRRFDGSSERDAYAESIAWIRARATRAAAVMAGRMSEAPGGMHPHAELSSQALGDALHAVQDSFAPGHAERQASADGHPGRIRRILLYAGAEKRGHVAGDQAWRGNAGDGFSDSGRQAVEASCALLRLVVAAAVDSEPGRPGVLDGFASFQDTWLAASDALSGARDRPIGLLERLLPR